MRVKVWSGDMSEFLGEGELIDRVTVYAWSAPDGTLISERAAEVVPKDDPAIDWFVPLAIENNPKIRLDSGRIVYGCQVWWREIKSEDNAPS